MAIDPEVSHPEPGEDPGAVGRGEVWWTTLAVTGPAGWFFLTWLGHGQNVISSAGESVGAATVLLLLVAVVGVSRRGRQR